MRRPIIAGNWKMNKTPDEAAAMIKELVSLVKDAEAEVVICAPFPDIPALKKAASKLWLLLITMMLLSEARPEGKRFFP